MEILAVAIWLAMAALLYVGLRARLLPHQPRWQAAAIVGAIAAALLAVGLVNAHLAQRPNYGVEDEGESRGPSPEFD